MSALTIDPSGDDLAAYLSEVTRLAASAGADAAAQALAFARVQRVAAWGLYTAVTAARDRGASWRDLAVLLDVSPATLHRRYQQGSGLTVPIPATPAVLTPEPEPVPVIDVDEATVDLFVGRQVELADLPVLLRQRRLVNLRGPAGVGKSRLALELVRRIRRSFRGGVAIFQLASAAGATAIERATATLCRDEQMLLVLDNCEHVVDETARIAACLLARYPQLRVLTTSREALEIPGEAQFDVRPLPPVPLDPGDPGLRASPAFQLFLDRARAAHRDVDEHLLAIAELCNGLDGLPLAIEMAARSARTLPPPLLLARFAERLDLLTGGARGAARHSTLRGAIEWGYNLLHPVEQAASRRLAALPGGFDHESAAAVLADLELSAAERWGLLVSLQAKSMIEVDPAEPGRFRMLASMRAACLDLLDHHGETGRVEHQLIAWFAGHAEQQAAVMWAKDAPDLYARTLAEHDNIRHAVEAAVRMGHQLRHLLTNQLAVCWYWHGDHARAVGLLEDMLRSPEVPDVERAKAHQRLAVIAADNGRWHAAPGHAAQALALAHYCGDERQVIKALNVQIYALRDHDPATALRLNDTQVEYLRRTDRSDVLMRSLANLAWLHLANGGTAAAQTAITEALDLMRGEEAEILSTAGAVALRQDGYCPERNDFFQRALRSTSPPHPICALVSLEGIAVVALRLGDTERAACLLTAATRLRDDHPGTRLRCWTDEIAAAHTAALASVGRTKTVAAAEGWSLGEAVEFALSGVPGRDCTSSTPLTARENEVVDLLVAGYTITQTATRLGISPRTVHSHLNAIRAKLDLPNVVAIAAWAAKRAAS
jgi:predicted ATPase/DNA-binding CsgD family transcriptional regulator/Tfp pilus assembly protein PilF